ncbi:winged helix DNA-binding domain-containing protein [Streptomyces sp. NPDC004539]|uniref:winged helix DNA-binding domain-containing protein n=1 Tax=Streptomyces sp. NPDC004539 TaxID=3154280 RepID=UPI0033BCCEA4
MTDIGVRALGRATLARQLLLRRERLAVPEAVRRVVALQAQQAASPYLALWNRVAGFDPAELDTAFAERVVVKATLMRITLHAVHADDHLPFRGAVQQTLYAGRLGYAFAEAGLTPADANRIVPELLEFAARPRVSTDLEGWLRERLGAEKAAGAWWGLRAYAPLLHVPTGGEWGFGGPRNTYVAAPVGGRFPYVDRVADPVGLRELILRYLGAFGPASVADIARFGMLYKGPVREALRGLGDAVEQLRGPEGVVLYDVPGAPRPDEDVPSPPRLLPMWDSVLLAHADRGRVLPEEYRRVVIRVNGDVLATVLVDGRVAGVWRVVDGGIEVSAFRRFTEDEWEGVASEAGELWGVLARRGGDPYRRFGRWWGKLPGAEEVRVVGGAR